MGRSGIRIRIRRMKHRNKSSRLDIIVFCFLISASMGTKPATDFASLPAINTVKRLWLFSVGER
jgi:hypothetical protein